MTEQITDTFMQNISDAIGENQFASCNAVCIDCKKEIKLELERTSETVLIVKNGIIARKKSTNEVMCKCDSCFTNSGVFGGDTEVYSRVVGYLRPVASWNGAKQSEFSMRATSEVTKDM